ncbi:Hypp8795 [Branchiostoma lanceolatum]|uniref:Hypp8795 protein n=1 Tax=Branchiostoma lanceolatum TaxID=7740 RepID=A0A8K0EJ30_BRALA|nr:Hypp8795 [Branchiostoma lanceolatum]
MKVLALLVVCLGLVRVQGMPVSDVGGRESARAIGGMANAIANIFDRVGAFMPPREPEGEEGLPEEKEVDLVDIKPASEKKEEKEGFDLDDMFAKSAMGMMKGMDDMMKGFKPMMSDMMKEMEDLPDMGDMMKDMPMMGDMMRDMPMIGEIDINLDQDDPDFSKETTESKKVAGDTIITHKKESKHTGKDGSVSYVNAVDKKQGGGRSYSVVKVYENNKDFDDLFGPDAVPSPTPMPVIPDDSEDEAEPENEAVPETVGDTTAEEDELDPALFGPDAIPSPTPMPDLPVEEIPMDAEVFPQNSEENQDGGNDDGEKPVDEEQLNRALFFQPHDDDAREAMFGLI